MQILEAAYGRFEARTPRWPAPTNGYQIRQLQPLLGDGRRLSLRTSCAIPRALQDRQQGLRHPPWSVAVTAASPSRAAFRELIASEALQRASAMFPPPHPPAWWKPAGPLGAAMSPSPTRSFGEWCVLARTTLASAAGAAAHLGQPQQLERLLRHVVAIY